MASDRTTLKVSERSDFGSRTTRRLRRDGLVPGVVYSEGSEARAFSVSEREARVALAQGGALLDLELGSGKAEPVVVKEEQRHPVRGDLVHLDLQVVRLDQAIQADVAIELLGADEAPGVTEGGVLEHITHQITISALPTEIPESIPADVSGMVIGDTMQLDSVQIPEGVELVLGEGIEAEEVTIATLNPPRVEEEPEPAVAEEAERVGAGEAAPAGAEAPEAEAEGEAGDSGDDDSGEE